MSCPRKITNETEMPDESISPAYMVYTVGFVGGIPAAAVHIGSGLAAGAVSAGRMDRPAGCFVRCRRCLFRLPQFVGTYAKGIGAG